MKRFAIPIQIACLLLIGLASYSVSLWVGAMQDQVQGLERRADQTREAIDLLNTELASLGRFDRIQAISDTQLALVAPVKGQMVQSVAELVSLAPGVAPEAEGVAVRPQAPSETRLVSYELPAQRAPAASMPQDKPAPAVVVQTVAAPLGASHIGPSLVAAIDSAIAVEARTRP